MSADEVSRSAEAGLQTRWGSIAVDLIDMPSKVSRGLLTSELVDQKGGFF